jgi:drug/metabolite transporter (DMT)-like permease
MSMSVPSPRPVQLSRGYATALASSLFLSTTAIFIRYLVLEYRLPELVLAFWRDLFTVVTISIVLLFLNRNLLQVERKNIPYLIVYGFILATFNSLWTLSVALNGAAIATVLVYSSAAFTALLGWIFLREGLGWAKLLAVIICMLGCALVSGVITASDMQLTEAGMLCGLLAGMSYALYSLMGRAASQRGINPWSTLLYTFTFATLILLGVNLLGGETLPGGIAHPGELFWLGNHWTGWLVLFLLAAGPTVAGFGLYNVSLGHLPASVVNLVLTTEPVFTAFFAYLIFGEELKNFQWAGGLLILSGVVWLRFYEGWLVNRKKLNQI